MTRLEERTVATCFEVETGMALRKETTCRDLISMSRQENKQINNWSCNLNEGKKLDMMSQHEMDAVTRDQNGLQ